MAKKRSAKNLAESDCPCQSGLSYARCCGRFLHTAFTHGSEQEPPAQPETAEQLMRSRYTAYVLGNADYLLNTWHPQYRPSHLELDKSSQKWLGLSIKHTRKGQPQDDTGEVHFIARYKINGKAGRLEEHSRFVKINRQWFYTTGQIR